MKIGRAVRKGCCLSLILFKSYIGYLTKEALKGFGGLIIIFRTMKCADNLVVLITEETVLRDVIDRLTEIEMWYQGKRMRRNLRKCESQSKDFQYKL